MFFIEINCTIMSVSLLYNRYANYTLFLLVPVNKCYLINNFVKSHTITKGWWEFL